LNNDPFSFVDDQNRLASTLVIGVATGAGITGSGCGVQSIGTRVGALGS